MADDTITLGPSNAPIAVRDEGDTEALDEPREGMTTPQKVAVGAGVTGAVGLAGFGLFRLGQRFGWWGRTTIVIDDETTTDSSSKKSGGGSSRARAIGKPPNTSGDPEGYNTELFPHPGAVRMALITTGYKVAVSGDPLVTEGQSNAEVQRFQSDWNKVIHGLDSGKVEFPTPVDDPSKLKQFRGLLVVDGIPGKNTLNGLEIAFGNTLKNKMKWTKLTGQT